MEEVNIPFLAGETQGELIEHEKRDAFLYLT